jgi:hypothetical protein
MWEANRDETAVDRQSWEIVLQFERTCRSGTVQDQIEMIVVFLRISFCSPVATKP